jgi:acyl-CoA thioesterase-1
VKLEPVNCDSEDVMRQRPMVKRSLGLFMLTKGLPVLALAIALTAVPAHAATVKLVAFGDSLFAGYGLAQKDSFPARLDAALRANGHDVAVINAGVSGDTTAGGLARFDWAVPKDGDAVMLELGANDALRGINPKVTRNNLRAILDRLANRRVPVLIVGMRSPANWGKDYTKAFDAIFGDLAKATGQDLYPFFLDGVALDKNLNQPDGLHPNAAGVEVIVKRILPSVEALLARVKS